MIAKLYIDIKNIHRLLRIVLRLVSWTHSNDSQHLCLEGETCHTKRLNKTQLTHLPYHANHSQMSIAFAHEAALAMERRSVNYQFQFRQLDRTSIISREGTLTANKSLISISAIHYIVI